ncbi:unnamed protein product, partial [Choristocarpus tenellus]
MKWAALRSDGWYLEPCSQLVANTHFQGHRNQDPAPKQVCSLYIEGYVGLSQWNWGTCIRCQKCNFPTTSSQ